MIDHYRGYIRVSRFRHRDGPGRLAVAVSDNDDELIIIVRLWEWSE